MGGLNGVSQLALSNPITTSVAAQEANVQNTNENSAPNYGQYDVDTSISSATKKPGEGGFLDTNNLKDDDAGFNKFMESQSEKFAAFPGNGDVTGSAGLLETAWSNLVAAFPGNGGVTGSAGKFEGGGNNVGGTIGRSEGGGNNVGGSIAAAPAPTAAA